MQQVIDGKRYNTNTAKLLVEEYSTGVPRSDFRWWEEGLYKTKNGAYFLAGEGGALSHYSQSCGNGKMGGSKIIPMSEEEALQWCELRNAEIPECLEHLIQEA